MLTLTAYGASYRINDPGGIIGKCLRTGEPYEAKVLHHIYRQKLTGLAVDVGASVGNHALWFAAICGLRVIAAEPLDHVRLRENVALNPDLPIEVWPMALGADAKRTRVVGPPAHVVGEGFPADGTVPTGRLDDFALEGLALLKVDVEGMEPEVLRGASETIARERPLIFAEAQDAGARKRNTAVLKPLGYARTRSYGATPLDEWRPR